MNKLLLRKIFLFIFILSLAISSCSIHSFHKNPEKGLFGKTHGNRKGVKVKEPGSVQKARKKQEANDRKLKKDYEKSVKRSQQRTIDIQTPEVQARMKQDKKNSAARDKMKKKKIKTSTRKAAKKYT